MMKVGHGIDIEFLSSEIAEHIPQQHSRGEVSLRGSKKAVVKVLSRTIHLSSNLHLSHVL